ncbi:hypothetical protein [Streptomyces sp. NPDC050738]|uniref:hypothetical protein n=1 Tax=Streptomyces sp. NPDC050738 TaxID=3154744 RepID=UPI00341663B2
MTHWQIYALIAVTATLATLAGLVGMFRASSLPSCDTCAECDDQAADKGGLFAEDYLVGFDAMKAAVLTANRETEPGGPSADLIDCWGVWSDAPRFPKGGDLA